MLSAQDQKSEYGYYSVQNYTHEAYAAHFQNWFITQDKNGFMYAANGQGILEFDGSSWRLITSPGQSSVRTVVVDDKNIKWVGADRDLGYLAPDSSGFLQFKSLKDKIPASHPLTANVWQVFPEDNRILFFTDNMIYSYRDGQFQIIPHPGPGPIHREYKVNGIVYVSISGEGMFQISGDSLQSIPGGSLFKNVRPTIALPYGSEAVLFVSRASGLFVYDGATVTPLENEVDTYLRKNNLYAGHRLPDASYAFATLRGGVVLMDQQGKWVKTVTEEDGILNNQVHGLALDRQKGLWMALQTGISRIEPFLPYRFFDKRSGLKGTVSAMARHQGTLYAGTFDGLFVLEPKTGAQAGKFRRIEDIKVGCFALLSTTNGLLAATANGVYLIKEREVVRINDLLGVRALYPSKRNSDRIYVGHMHGLATVHFKNGKWQKEEGLDQIKEDVFSIVSEDDGTLWLGTSTHQVVRIRFSHSGNGNQDKAMQRPIVDYFTDVLPEASTKVYLIDKEILVTSDGAGGPLFKFNTGTGTFSRELHFGKKFGLDSLSIYPMAYQNDGRYILLETNDVNGKTYRFSAWRNDSGTYSVKRLYDERFRSTTQTRLFWDDKTVLWSGGEDLVRYDLGTTYNFNPPFDTYVRKVTVGQDSIIHGGEKSAAFAPVLKYSGNDLRFEFAAPHFMGPEGNRYRYSLSGFDAKWSDWTAETKKEYTNIPQGNYQFMAEAQDIYGNIGTVGTFNFRILPLWYRTWWAYFIYVLLVIGFFWVILRWRSRQLKANNIALEKLIAVRTSEVQHQANQLKIQAEKLQELDKAKSRFFANISHEFRTPLTLIKGPIEQLEQNFTERLNRETVKMIRRNANRLLNMVNQLLDLSKIDEGSLKLSPTEGDVYKCLRAAASSFNSHAAQRNIDYRVQIPQTVLWASFDRDKLENIVYNLLGNAFKFSGDSSEISFISEYTEDGLQIQVSDTGKGIPEEKLPFIFDRFYQIDSGNNREKGGSGIGLSLSKDLIELMKGSITVSSEVGKGSFFLLVLPIQKIRPGSNKEDGVEISDDFKSRFQSQSFEFNQTDKRIVPTILLVEDNKDMRHFIKEQLIGFYKVKEAMNGETGLKKAIADTPNLIITDLMMPKMDGIELCKKLKTDVHTSHIPVIMLTAKAGIDNRLEGLETGADDYLTKPFDGKELLVRIKNLIEQRQKLRELYGSKAISLDPKKIALTSVDQKFLERVLELLEANFSNPDFGVPQMQEALAMSKTQLHRKLKSLTNEPPGELLRNFRLKRAAQLLSQKVDSVTQVAYQVGFNNLSYFAKCFRELYGTAPSSY